MFKKLNNKKGFTLMEMLIVVAIIAILIAIAIPAFTSALERARQTTDIANIRAAYAEAMVSYLAENTTVSVTSEEMLQHDGDFGKIDVPDYLKASGGSYTGFTSGKKALVTISESGEASVKVN